ncbi:hypothetical protein [Photobacterium sanguinicancri]|uniref:hypothetical protein n=1 Tax=Photobacterium sanguinicancri TaxID=875932 RepID=UPI0026E39903|nr:hypothetical protein [Photobacterium sanguinicancri]MDO6500537.1 hypothetical protein [Photobacterium sanguinicancri]
MLKDTVTNPIFSHLTEDQVLECYEMYRNNELKNSEIIELYDLYDLTPNTLVSQFPLLRTGIACQLCSNDVLERPTSKSGRFREYVCPKCNHKVSEIRADPMCRCDHCESERQEKRRKEREALELRYQENLDKLKKIYPVPSVKLSYGDLSLVDKIYLASLIPLGSRDLLPSQIVASSNSILSPAGVLDKAIYSHLLDKGVIFPVLENLPTEVVLNPSERMLSSRQVYQANIYLNVTDTLTNEVIYRHILSDFEQIMNGNIEVQKKDIEQLCNLVEHIEVAEAVVFLSYFCQEADLAEPPQKTYDVIRKMLTQMCVAQLAPHIKKSVKDAAYFYMTGKSQGKPHATNTIPSKLESSVAYYQKQGWAANKWDRPYNTEKSNLSNVVYDKLLVHLNLGFYQSVGDIVQTIEHFFEQIRQLNKQNVSVISDKTGANVKRCAKCDSSNLELLESRKGILALCLDCNDSLLLQPAIES